MINEGRTLHLSNLGYKEMTGTYKCFVTGIGGQSNGSGTLEVYCKYSSAELTEQPLCLCHSDWNFIVAMKETLRGNSNKRSNNFSS